MSPTFSLSAFLQAGQYVLVYLIILVTSLTMIIMFQNSTTNMQQQKKFCLFYFCHSQLPKNVLKLKKHNFMMFWIYLIRYNHLFTTCIVFYNIYYTIFFARLCNSSVITDVLCIYNDAKSMYVFIQMFIYNNQKA